MLRDTAPLQVHPLDMTLVCLTLNPTCVPSREASGTIFTVFGLGQGSNSQPPCLGEDTNRKAAELSTNINKEKKS